jgi:hypothetical protein
LTNPGARRIVARDRVRNGCVGADRARWLAADRRSAMSGTPTFGRYAEIPVDQIYTAVSLTMNFYDVPAGSPGLAR